MGLGSLIGGILGVGGDSGAGGTLAGAQAQFNNLKVPEIEEQKVKLEEMVLQGKLTPEQATAYLQDSTGLSEISIDPKLKAAQMGALSSLQDIASSGGLTMSDKARLQEVSDQVGAQERGSREAILQNARSRGIGGSGLELASMLGNSQAAAGRRSSEGLNTAARAEERALQALLQSGEMAGGMRGQEFEEQAKVAQAQDAINQFNTANKQSVLNNNVNTRNAAQQYNLGAAQDVHNQNVGIRNTQETTNKGLYQQQFQNNLSKAQGAAGLSSAQAQMQEAQKARSDQFTGALIGAGGSIAGGFASKSDERVKENIESGDTDIEQFLKSLSVNKYDYKKPYDDGEKHVSVMAQDLEKTPLGQKAVREDAQGVKEVNYAKLLPEILASLAHLNQKIGG